MKPSWDVFCQVVDNFGDVGVCWRLARQLSSEHGAVVRLWLDDVGALAAIWSDVDGAATRQIVADVEVCRWDECVDWAQVTPHGVVVEGFACALPAGFVAQMLAVKNRAGAAPVWVNLEYLSAEDWVDGCHRLTSPQNNGLVKTFFFPGFTARTGGLLRERGLLARRDAVLQGQPSLWGDLTGFNADKTALKIVLFGYETMKLAEWLPLLIASQQPIQLAVASGKATVAMREAWRLLGLSEASLEEGGLSIRYMPMLRQDGFDGLLWAADFNFVRGEDSLVRALWAGKPLTWQIYPQDDGVHFDKLAAFNHKYADARTTELTAWMNWQRAWNAEPMFKVKTAWLNLIPNLKALTQHAHHRAAQWGIIDDLAQQLSQYVQECNSQ